MNLKDFLSKDVKNKEHYWAVTVEPGWIQAGVWEIGDGKAEVISIGPATAWETDDDLVSAGDTALSAAVQNLSEEIEEPQKTVFGVAPSWVSEGQIKKEYLEKIRKICTDLSLTPSGFVVLPEAIANFIKSQEGTPLNGIVVGFGKENIEVAVFRLGNLSGITAVARSVSVSDDVLEGLTRFDSTQDLPSRFLLYDGKEGELEDTRQALLGVSWEDVEKVKFLHTPKVEIIDPDRKVMATALAGASEMANISHVEKSARSLGGVEESGAQEEIENVTSPKESVAAGQLGFTVGEDIAKEPREEPSQSSVTETAPLAPEVKKSGISNFTVGAKDKILAIFRNIKTRFFGPLAYGSTAGRMFIGGAVALVVFLIVGFILWWYLPKATVTIYVSPKNLQDRLSLVVDTNAKAPDFAKSTIPGEVLKTEVSGEKTTSTSGTKTIGDKATGEVTFYRAGDAVTLSSGITLTSATGLKFTLDSSVSVATGSADSPGKGTGKVTASDIGPDYNLASGTTFKVGNYPADLTAKNDSAFSGGSSREISAVSADDQKKLEKDLTTELLGKAKDEIGQTLASTKFLIEESLSATPSSRVFSNKIGDEAGNLKLSLDLSVKGVSVEKSNLFDLARETLKSKVPAGYVLRDEQLDFVFDLSKVKDGVYQFDVSVSANLLPEIKPDDIAKKISGKYPPLAQSFLSTIPGFVRAEINLKPRFPGRLGTLPMVVKNIVVEVAAER